MGFLKPKAPKQESKNLAYGQINQAYAPTVETGNRATNFIAGLLGVPGGDSSGASAAFERYKDQAGFAPALRELQRGIVGGNAAGGMLRSGSTSNRLLQRGAELNQGFFGNFLQQLAGLSGLGLQGGGLIANTGQTSTGTGGSPSTAGTIASTIGGLASIFSDRRVKRDVTPLTLLEDGLGVYAFRYLGDEELRIGVMADEVAAIRPWALGPEVGGFSTVNYGAL